jgi:hypothetical protein
MNSNALFSKEIQSFLLKSGIKMRIKIYIFGVRERRFAEYDFFIDVNKHCGRAQHKVTLTKGFQIGSSEALAGTSVLGVTIILPQHKSPNECLRWQLSP